MVYFLYEDIATEYIQEENSVAVTVSIGVAYCEEAADRRSVLDSADKALYEAKKHGRNTYCIKKMGK